MYEGAKTTFSFRQKIYETPRKLFTAFPLNSLQHILKWLPTPFYTQERSGFISTSPPSAFYSSPRTLSHRQTSLISADHGVLSQAVQGPQGANNSGVQFGGNVQRRTELGVLQQLYEGKIEPLRSFRMLGGCFMEHRKRYLQFVGFQR